MTAAQFLARYTADFLLGGRQLARRADLAAMAEAVAAGRGFAAVTDAAGALVAVKARAEDCGAWMPDAVAQAGYTVGDFNPPAPRYSVEAGRNLFRDGEHVARIVGAGQADADALAATVAAALNAHGDA